MKLETDGHCFVCGKKNKEGLQLEFEIDPAKKTLRTMFVPAAKFQGYDGIVHGGLIATLLDEAMAKLCYELGYHIVTASLEVRFKNPAPVLQPYVVSAEIVEVRKKFVKAKARVTRNDGTPIALGTSTLIRHEWPEFGQPQL